MITAAYVQTLARYGAWQNQSQTQAADVLTEAERRKDRGAFFRSIEGTLNHLLWGDRIWLSRFAGSEAPAGGIAESVALTADWRAYRTARADTDAAIAAWAGSLTDADLQGDLRWFSGAAGREIAKPRAILIAHLFNHATHHRGQVHAMLTAAGARPEPTDLFLLNG